MSRRHQVRRLLFQRARSRKQQADLRDLSEVARVVRLAFCALLERDTPGALEKLKNQVWATMQDRHQQAVQSYQRAPKGTMPRPQPPSVAGRDRTMFSLIMFDLEDRVLDCIDRHLKHHGWTVASLIFDGVHVEHRDDGDLPAALRSAEAAVKEQLGYAVALLEKPMYGPAELD